MPFLTTFRIGVLNRVLYIVRILFAVDADVEPHNSSQETLMLIFLISSWNVIKIHWNPEFKSRNPDFLQRLQSGIQVPLVQYVESGIQSVKSSVQDCLRLPYMERFVLVMGLSGIQFRE